MISNDNCFPIDGTNTDSVPDTDGTPIDSGDFPELPDVLPEPEDDVPDGQLIPEEKDQ